MPGVSLVKKPQHSRIEHQPIPEGSASVNVRQPFNDLLTELCFLIFEQFYMEYGNHHWNKNRNSFIFDEKVTSKSAWLWAAGPATGLFPVLDVAGVPVMWPVIRKIVRMIFSFPYLPYDSLFLSNCLNFSFFVHVYMGQHFLSFMGSVYFSKKIPYTYENIFYAWTLLNTSTLGHVIPARPLLGARHKNQAAWQTTCTQIPLGSCS